VVTDERKGKQRLLSNTLWFIFLKEKEPLLRYTLWLDVFSARYVAGKMPANGVQICVIGAS